jgi:protein ImuA
MEHTASPATPSLAALRERLRAVQPPARHGVLPFGDARVDDCLAGGLPLGQVHEIGADGIEAETGTLAAAFAASWLARLVDPRPVLWIAPPPGRHTPELYPPGLFACGLDPARLLLARSGGDGPGRDGTLAVMEAALREGAVAVVVAEAGRVGRLAGRRLHLAALAHGSTGFLLRRWPHGRAATRDAGAVAAVATRWRLAPAPSVIEQREPGAARWRVELLHAAGGRPGAWLMQQERDDAPVSLRVVAGLADPAAAARRVG